LGGSKFARRRLRTSNISWRHLTNPRGSQASVTRESRFPASPRMLPRRRRVRKCKEDEVAPPTFTSSARDIGCGFIARLSQGGYDMRQSPDSLALL
jgi:hypothetical protein